MSKLILDPQNTWKLLSQGVMEVHEIVSRTYGPHGGKVMVSKRDTILVTTDGAALTQETQLADTRRIGAALVRAAALKTEAEVGDGTSTTVILAGALTAQLERHSADPSWNPVQTVAEIREAAEIADAVILATSLNADRSCLERVAKMATHEDDALAEKVVEAILAVGEEGAVVLTPHEGTNVVLEHHEGLQLSQGWASSDFSSGAEHEMDGPLVAVFKSPLRTAQDVTSVMETATQWPGRGLLVFAPFVGGEALAMLVTNHKKGVLTNAAVEYSGNPQDMNDWLEDIATVTNATVVDATAGMDLSNFEGHWLGYVRKAVLTQKKTTLISYMDDNILERIETRVSQLKRRADDTGFSYERNQLVQRAASLDGGLCTLKIGGHSAQEAQDRRSRAEDALLAVQTCLRSGVVPGAGMTFLAASVQMPETLGGKMVRTTLQSVARALITRSGVEAEPEIIRALSVLHEDPTGWRGFDPTTRTWRHFGEDPKIIDPTDVCRSALRNAISVICQIALSGAVIFKSEPPTRPDIPRLTKPINR